MQKLIIVFIVAIIWVGIFIGSTSSYANNYTAFIGKPRGAGVTKIVQTQAQNQIIAGQTRLARSQVQQLSIPTKTQYLGQIEHIQQTISDKNISPELAKTQLDFILKTAQNDDILSKKNARFEEIKSMQVAAKNYHEYFAQTSQFQTEKNTVAQVEELSQKLYRRRFDSTLTAEEMDKIIQAEFTPKLAALKNAKSVREEAIKKEEERQKFLAQRALQDRQNKALGVTAPQSPLPNTPKMIFVSISNQTMYSYEYGIPVQATPVVTGKPGFETVKGQFSIYKKERKAILNSPFDDISYAVPVDYWMPFYSGYGIHDATWRQSFGGQIYQSTSGSHGCVNTPANVAAWMFNWAELGTPVVVQ